MSALRIAVLAHTFELAKKKLTIIYKYIKQKLIYKKVSVVTEIGGGHTSCFEFTQL